MIFFHRVILICFKSYFHVCFDNISKFKDILFLHSNSENSVLIFSLLPLSEKARLKPSCINQTYLQNLLFEFGLIEVAFLSVG